jgi:hypothetical protein
MIYTLPVTAHSAKSLRKLQSKATQATLNKLGFNRHTPLSVAFGPSLNLGLSLRDLPTEQGIALMVMIVQHLRSNSDQGRLLFIALSWWQLVLGTSYPLLQHPQRPILYDDSHLLSATRQFLKTVNGALHIPVLSSALPVPFCAQDQCLMDHFSLLPGATRATLDAANRVRLFLRCCISFRNYYRRR